VAGETPVKFAGLDDVGRPLLTCNREVRTVLRLSPVLYETQGRCVPWGGAELYWPVLYIETGQDPKWRLC
jgi:hypothetical protein